MFTYGEMGVFYSEVTTGKSPRPNNVVVFLSNGRLAIIPADDLVILYGGNPPPETVCDDEDMTY